MTDAPTGRPGGRVVVGEEVVVVFWFKVVGEEVVVVVFSFKEVGEEVVVVLLTPPEVEVGKIPVVLVLVLVFEEVEFVSLKPV